MLTRGKHPKKQKQSNESVEETKRVNQESARPHQWTSSPKSNQFPYTMNDKAENSIGEKERSRRTPTELGVFRSSKIMRAIRDAIPDLNKQKADNLLIALEEEMPGKYPFKDKTFFSTFMSSVSNDGRKKWDANWPLILNNTMQKSQESQRMHGDSLYEMPVEAIEDSLPVVDSSSDNQRNINADLLGVQLDDEHVANMPSLDDSSDSSVSSQADSEEEERSTSSDEDNQSPLEDHHGGISMVLSALQTMDSKLTALESALQTVDNRLNTIESALQSTTDGDQSQKTQKSRIINSSLYKAAVMEHILRDKTCGLYPSDSTWKAMANTVYGENENLEEYSRHLKEIKRQARLVRHSISDDFKSAFLEIYGEYASLEKQGGIGGERSVILLNEAGKKAFLTGVANEAESSGTDWKPPYRWKKGDPYGNRNFRRLLVKLQCAHLDAAKMRKEALPDLHFVEEDENISNVVISTIPAQILAFYIFKIEILLKTAQDKPEWYHNILKKVKNERPSKYVTLATLEQHGLRE